MMTKHDEIQIMVEAFMGQWELLEAEFVDWKITQLLNILFLDIVQNNGHEIN